VNGIVRLVEVGLAVGCLGALARRYLRSSVVVAPADLLLWAMLFFYVVPLALSGLLGHPEYQLYPAIARASSDALVRSLGAVVIVFTTLLLVRAALATQREVADWTHYGTRRNWQMAWVAAGCFLPLIAVAFSPNPSVYRHFAAAFVLREPWQPFHNPQSEHAQYHILVSWATYLSVISYAVLLRVRPRKWVILLLPVFGGINLWLSGKRHIIAVLLLVAAFSLLLGRPLDRRRMRQVIFGMALLGIALLSASAWYQSHYRPHLAAAGLTEEVAWIDFSRLDVLYLALAPRTGLEQEIPLSYPGHSLLLHGKALLGDEDSVSYADRVTSIAMDSGISRTPGAITTSFLSEAVDNLGIIGTVVGPLALYYCARRRSLLQDDWLGVVGPLALVLLMVVHVLAVLPVLALLVSRGLVVAARRSTQRRSPLSITTPRLGVSRREGLGPSIPNHKDVPQTPA
jgi:hypothetical protein